MTVRIPWHSAVILGMCLSAVCAMAAVGRASVMDVLSIVGIIFGGIMLKAMVDQRRRQNGKGTRRVHSETHDPFSPR